MPLCARQHCVFLPDDVWHVGLHELWRSVESDQDLTSIGNNINLTKHKEETESINIFIMPTRQNNNGIKQNGFNQKQKTALATI